ncbi:hypothetical protein B0H11DRAFT_2093926, partial [Mycena galericulata]
MNPTEVLQIFRTGPSDFRWETSFPEPGLDEALLQARDILYALQEIKPTQQRTLINVVDEVTFVRQVFYHYWVAEDQVDARMEVMGMHRHWRAIQVVTNVEFLLVGVPRRDPEDKGCVNFRTVRSVMLNSPQAFYVGSKRLIVLKAAFSLGHRPC